jgi:glycosyltransferase involved in cell wall biosynthesis
MKILLLAPMVPQAEGAGAIPLLLEAQLAGLRERHEVALVTAIGDEPREAEAAAALRAGGIDVHLADRRRPQAGIRRWRRRRRLAGAWLRRPWPWRTVWFADPGIQAKLDELAAAQRFDVVAVEDSSMAVFRLPAGVPAVLTEHEVRRPRPLAPPPTRPAGWIDWAFGELDWRRWRGFQGTAWRRFDLIQAFGERDAAAISSLAPDLATRVRVNPFGLSPPPAAEPEREERGTLLFAGNFTHPPNRDAAHWLAREIMPIVLASKPRAHLRIVGSAPPAATLGLAGDRVEVIADAPVMRPHLEAASVVLAPVRIGGGMRMKVLHAMAAGKPVITTLRGAEGYRGAPECPLVVADGAAAIARATIELIGDDEKRRALGRRGREFALDRHSPAAWSSRLEAVYGEAIERSRSDA